MSHLSIEYFSGEGFEHPLIPTEAVSIGKNDSNDITIDGPDVGLMHCRIMWKKNSFEVTAANLDGVELNGTCVRQAKLKSGDVMRIGDADITIHIKTGVSNIEQVGSDRQKPEVANPGEVSLKPLSDEELLIPLESAPEKETKQKSVKKSAKKTDKKMAKKKSKRNEKKRTSAAKKRPARKQTKADSAFPDDFFEDEEEDDGTPYELGGDDDDDFDEDDLEEDEDVSARPVLKRMGGNSSGDSNDDETAEPVASEDDDQKGESQGSGLSMIKGKLKRKPVRPGDREAARSPIVLTLAGGAFFLIVAAFTIWWVIGRTSAQNYYNAALEEKESHKYAQAITMLEKFALTYPGSDLKEEAFYSLCEARIEQPLFSSSQTKWADGLNAVHQFKNLNRDKQDFKDHIGDLYAYSRKIALGAAEDALNGKGKLPPARRALLKTASDANGLVEKYGDKDEANTMEEFIANVKDIIAEATTAIEKQEDFLSAQESIEKALEKKDPMKAFSIRLDLIQQHPTFANDRKLNGLVIKTLETEQSLINQEDNLNQVAFTKEIASPVPSALSLTLQTRLLSAETSDGRTIFAVAKDCSYGIDVVTGQPIWRRVTGLDSPFFPIPVQTNVEGVLLFNTNQNELMLLERRTGKLIWRQPINGVASGKPLVHEGQIYLPTLSNQLWKIDLESGKASSRLTFSQPIVATPLMISDGKQLAVSGDQAVVYLLSTRPLKCQSVSYLGHDSGSVETSLVAMGSLVLIPENDGLDNCQLRVLQLSSQTNKLVEIDKQRLGGELTEEEKKRKQKIRTTGIVRDAPVIRGNKLFIPASNEKVYAYTASDEPGQPPLTYITKNKIPKPRDVTTYLSAGPDKQLWMGSSALYRLQLKPKEIRLLGDQKATGTMTQPMQLIGQHLYLGRQSYFSTATLFIRIEREKMDNISWRVVLGSQIIAMATKQDSRGTTLVCLTEAGDGFKITENDLVKGGFKKTAGELFRYSKDLDVPIKAIRVTNTKLNKDNKLFAYIGGKKPRGWWINSLGQSVKMTSLSRPVEGRPISLGAGVVLPQKGQLQLFFGRGGRRVKEYAAAIEKGKEFHWKFLSSIDETQFLAYDNQNQLHRVQYRKSPVHHLAKAALLDLEKPLDVPPVYHQGVVAIADSAGMLKLLDVQSLDTIAEKKLLSPATNRLWVLDNTLLVETGYNQLTAFQADKELAQLWSVTFSNSKNGLAGAPLLVGGKFLLATRSGEAITVESQKGKIINRIETNEILTSGVMQVGNSLVAPTLDGSLIRVDAVMQSAPKQATPQKETSP